MDGVLDPLPLLVLPAARVSVLEDELVLGGAAECMLNTGVLYMLVADTDWLAAAPLLRSLMVPLLAAEVAVAARPTIGGIPLPVLCAIDTGAESRMLGSVIDGERDRPCSSRSSSGGGGGGGGEWSSTMPSSEYSAGGSRGDTIGETVNDCGRRTAVGNGGSGELSSSLVSTGEPARLTEVEL